MTASSGLPDDATEIEAGRRQLGISGHDLWVSYFGRGGNASLEEIGRWLVGEAALPAHDHDVLAIALNEAFDSRGLNHPIPYRNQ